MILNGNGYLGLGTNASYRLEVLALAGNTPSGVYKYINTGNTSNALTYSSSTSFSTVCAKFNSSIWATGFVISVLKKILNILIKMKV